MRKFETTMMSINILYFVVGVSVSASQSIADDCVPPILTNGVVTEISGSSSSNMYVGRFSCKPGHTLVGKTIIKCRAGKWSASFPVCTTVGKCDPAILPSIANGHKQRMKKYRGSVYKLKCFRGFQRYGPSLVHCSADKWNINSMPVCTRPGCDSTNMESILFGKSFSHENGAVRTFSCDEGSTMVGSSLVFCDGRDWNDTAPRCLKAPSRVMVTGPQKVRHGEKMTLECSTSSSFPASSIKWRVEQSGKVLEYSNPQMRIIEEEDGSFVTQSIMSTSVTATEGDLVAECYATNMALGEDYRAYVHVVQVISPPSLPVITGLPEGGVVPANIELSLTCEATAGNPPAQLYWYEGDEMLKTETKVEGAIVRAVVELVPHNDDIDLRCEAINEALSEPVTQSINIVVDKNPDVDYSQAQSFVEDDFTGGYSLGTTEIHQIEEFRGSNQIYHHKINDNNIRKDIESLTLNGDSSTENNNIKGNLGIENYTIKEEVIENNIKDDVEKIQVASSAPLTEDRVFNSPQIQNKACDKTLSLTLVLFASIASAISRTLQTQ